MTEEKVYIQCTVGGPVRVYTKDGVITRMRPIIFDDSDAASWTIEARGKKYTPPRKTTLQSYEVPERQRVYTNRIQYPMRRKNFDPNGDRHPELRGKDEYERISWDEALDLVAGEITRIRETYGPAAITAMTSSHHNWGFLHYKLGPLGRFFNILGYSMCLDNPDSWEGWHWGATHTWGYWWRLGHCEQSELLQDALKHTEQIIFWSVDPNSTSYMYSGQENLIWRQWMKELGIQFVVIDPHNNCTMSTMGDKWIAPRPGTDAALAEAIAYVWLTEDTYDHFFIENRTYGFDDWKKHILGQGEDKTPKTPQWAADDLRRPGSHHHGSGARVGGQEDHAGRGQHLRSHRRLPSGLRHRVVPAVHLPHGHAGLRQAGGQLLGRHRQGFAPRHGLPHVRLLRQRLGRLRHGGREVVLPRGQPGDPEDLPHPAAGHRHEPAGELDRRRLLRPEHRAAVPSLHLPGGRARTARPSR